MLPNKSVHVELGMGLGVPYPVACICCTFLCDRKCSNQNILTFWIFIVIIKKKHTSIEMWIMSNQNVCKLVYGIIRWLYLFSASYYIILILLYYPTWYMYMSHLPACVQICWNCWIASTPVPQCLHIHLRFWQGRWHLYRRQTCPPWLPALCIPPLEWRVMHLYNPVSFYSWYCIGRL